jgi:hypothetical protein
VTSTTSKWGFSKLDWFFVAAKSSLLLYAAVLIIGSYGCGTPPQEQQPAPRNRVPTITQTQTETPTPAPKAEPAPEKEPPYYGSTYWDELLTSVYYYPSGDKGTVAVTHLKFGHREDDIYLCGDQRKSFAPGSKYRLLVTFEPNQPCITNWKIE